MHTHTTHPTPEGADPEGLDRRIADMDRDVANGALRDLHFPAGRPLAEALGYPPLCAHGMNSFADRRYDLARARLRRGRPSNAKRRSTSHQSKGTTMSPYLYRRLMRDKLARLRQRAGAAHGPQVRRP